MKLLLLALLTTSLFAFDFDRSVQQIKFYEGFSSKPYKDRNHISIGYGTNISHITRAEAELLLVHRLSMRLAKLRTYPWFNRLNPTRQAIVLDMSYQLGVTGLLKFKHMVWRLKHGYWNAAANAMRDSKWYYQSGRRSRQLVQQMQRGF